jgi:hypothetical protein
VASDRTRASDSERERVADRLRAAAAAGRITVEELDERSALAYAAVTRAQLAALLDDLPAPRHESAARPKRKLPRVPGRIAFTASWRGPADSRKAGADILEFIAPFLHAHGYDLIDRAPDRLVFSRRYQPLWTILAAIFLFPFGLLALLARADERIAIDMSEREGYTLTLVQGVAPLKVRRALADLED